MYACADMHIRVEAPDRLPFVLMNYLPCFLRQGLSLVLGVLAKQFRMTGGQVPGSHLSLLPSVEMLGVCLCLQHSVWVLEVEHWSSGSNYKHFTDCVLSASTPPNILLLRSRALFLITKGSPRALNILFNHQNKSTNSVAFFYLMAQQKWEGKFSSMMEDCVSANSLRDLYVISTVS